MVLNIYIIEILLSIGGLFMKDLIYATADVFGVLLSMIPINQNVNQFLDQKLNF